ncbi:MAG: histidine--tRNA ligase [Parcubacteria group bacterium]
MSKLDTAPYKGVRDFYPEDQFIQNYIFQIWRKTVRKYGFEEMDASILEYSEIYKEKSGEEIVNEQTFSFKDRGDRDVTLRPEMTPTVARMVAGKRRELRFPLRWYSIPNLFRYEAPQRGRLREHWQLNVDTFGIANTMADVELITLADSILKAFGAKPEDYEIRISTLREDKGDLTNVIASLNKSGIKNIRIDENLARGQAYYTGVVFEFFDTNKENPRSILGGGRYDNLTALFGDSDLPAVGFGAGDVTLRDFLETHGLLPEYKPATHLYVIPTDPTLFEKVAGVVSSLRDAGIGVAVDWTDRRLGDQIKAADKLKIPRILIIGEDELKTSIFALKELASGKETRGTLDEIISALK